MRARFLHLADCHLGYRQYNLSERFNDFGRAFHEVINVAIAEKVDFVLLAGDLFHKRAIDALTLNHAFYALERLKNAGIPCIAVQGNHEHGYYDDYIGWLEFLNIRQYLTLLDAKFEEGKPLLKPYKRPHGSYVDPLPWLRIHGLKYSGSSTAKGVAAYSEALVNVPRDGIEYTIFMTHAGVEGEVDQMGGLSMREWSCLRTHADYIALGHIHKPYNRDEWIYNPGSLETCSTAEVTWKDRGYYLVEVDTERGEGPKHRATLHTNTRRPFERFFLKTDLFTSPEALYQHANEMMTRRARDLGRSHPEHEFARPIVDFHLQGQLNFERSALSLNHLGEMAMEILKALHPLIRNDTHSPGYELEPGETMNRQVLERRVLSDLFSRDARFAPRSHKWASLALEIKTLTLDGAGSETILEELEERLARIDQDDGQDDDQEAAGDHGQEDAPEVEVALANGEAGDYANLNG